MKVKSKCSIVLVAGSALNELESVMKKVDSLGQDMMMVPYAIILLSPEKNIVLNTTRHGRSPAIVSITVSPSVVSKGCLRNNEYF